MLIGERMSRPVVTIPPDLPIAEALDLMKREHIRRCPIIDDGKLVGIISDKDLLNASPSPVTTLSIWEMHYLLSKITVSEVMTKNVLTVAEDTPIEEAARIMADNKIGGVPVMRDRAVVGIITETDLFKIFLELMGARELGVRVTATIQDKPGQLAALTEAISAAKGNFVAFGQFTGDTPLTRLVTFKVAGLTVDLLKSAIAPVITELIDIRSS
jgi:acetoin utilization protein AcuB